MSEFSIGKKDFMYNGKSIHLISGAIHYFRVPREYWRDRLLKIKACGFNTIETYTAWNLHEPKEGEFYFEDMCDLKAFLDLVKELDMFAIVRPGPYICSEWEFGALPWWLLKYDDIELRCMNDTYLEKVNAYFDKLIPIIAECQISNGGSVIMVQVENEYGSYGDDSEYIRYMAQALRQRGITCDLFTSDGTIDYMLTGGTVPEIHKTANFGSRATSAFKALRNFQPEGPLMCMEFWNGWFDHWGEVHHQRPAKQATAALKEILDNDASVSVYMMHGGTNFGYMNGANCSDTQYQPTVNSYDDDAPINEYGGLTKKYFLFKDLLANYGYKSDIKVEQPKTAGYGTITFTKSDDLFSNLDKLSNKFESTVVKPMEKYDQGYGYILYETFVRGPRNFDTLYLDVHDRAYVYLDGEFKGIQYRNDKKQNIKISIPKQGAKLSILVENMGRVNYGPYLHDKKGLVSPVRLGQQFIYHWDVYTLPLEDISSLGFANTNIAFANEPMFLKGNLNIADEPKDTFLKFKGFKKGLVYINGKLISRYWEKGPQATIYVPAPFLKQGDNEITVFECEGFKKPTMEFIDKPILNRKKFF